MASNRVAELVDAAQVLADAGDREGAERLLEEATRLAPQDELVLQVRAQLMGGAGPTPFAPPPTDLFADAAPKAAANPFARPAAPAQAGPFAPTAPVASPTSTPSQPLPAAPAAPQASPADALGDLLRSAMHTLEPGASPPPAPELPPSRPPASTDPYASRPAPPANPGPFGVPAAPTPVVPSHTGTLQYASLDEVKAAVRPPSQPEHARSRTLLAGEPVTPGGSPAPMRGDLEGVLQASLSPRPATRPPPPPREATPPPTRATSRPVSSAPYDAMDLIDAPRPEAVSGIPAQLKRARELLEFADHSGALQVVEQVLAEAPLNAEALALKTRCEATLTSMFESKLGDLGKRPKLRLRPDEVIWLNLDHRAGFVLAQIDGQVSLEDLFDLSGMSRLDTARILAQLVEEKVIQL